MKSLTVVQAIITLMAAVFLFILVPLFVFLEVWPSDGHRSEAIHIILTVSHIATGILTGFLGFHLGARLANGNNQKLGKPGE